ncbi:uncharacterized protein Z518_10744 [Rhinocladiella mackenziei CBS 650.93]|uniref:Potassium transport protein n=1 Tax=Rhinocladiella mackenziei CBS 650.93 TaxID=1442369 RepID=A0A0D2FCI7_9EURO|nr:uncharacterized protein Z518_10744 [Rhinocladiella mackenziei CBS 650.93]KIW99816.1 hypothetical protein Z518_10744 [Rhinocladiella mackenziei CBS 650.93]
MAEGLFVFYRDRIRPSVSEISFINWHYIYFCATCLLASIIFWGSSTPDQSVSYIDSLFLCISAMTEAGLNTVNLSQLNTWQQVMLFLLIIIGSAIFVSGAILHIRKRTFEKKLTELAEKRQERLQKRRSLGRALTLSFSRRKPGGPGDREAAVASGAVRGRPIQDRPEDEEYKTSFRGSERNQSPSTEPTGLTHTANGASSAPEGDQNGHIRFLEHLPAVEHTPIRPRPLRRHRTSFFEGRGVGAQGLQNHPRHSRPVDYNGPEDDSAIEDEPVDYHPHVSKIDKYLDTVNGYLGRNSQFYHLNERERKKLGGIEYDAICLLSWIVPLYFILFQLLGALGIGAWIKVNRPSVTLENGLDPFWTGAFFAISAFNNSGMALLDANATAFQTNYYVLLTLSLLILAGNTCFPPFLRLILWTMKKLIPKNSSSPSWSLRRRTLEFCLDHPRRVYTNLFPSAETWWLVFSLFMLNGLDWIAFELLNLGNPTIDAIPAQFRVLDGLFQAFAVRSGGFYVVAISSLRSGLLVLYVLMMYISAFPITMTIRNTNVYEERSLGIYADDGLSQPEGPALDPSAAPEEEKGKDPRRHKFFSGLRRTLTVVTHGPVPPAESRSLGGFTRQDFIRQQLRGQLGHDLWWIALAIFLITAIETGQFEREPVVFSTFNIIFETVSAYGCVGISMGVPWNAYSFCGAWHTVSKLVLCAVMLRGRHRGLPVSIDRAILLPDESLAWAEEEDAHKRSETFATALSRMGTRDVSALPRSRSRTSLSGPGPSVGGQRNLEDMV